MSWIFFAISDVPFISVGFFTWLSLFVGEHDIHKEIPTTITNTLWLKCFMLMLSSILFFLRYNLPWKFKIQNCSCCPASSISSRQYTLWLIMMVLTHNVALPAWRYKCCKLSKYLTMCSTNWICSQLGHKIILHSYVPEWPYPVKTITRLSVSAVISV